MSLKQRAPTREPRGVEVHMDTAHMHRVLDGAAESLGYGTATERYIMAADLARTALRHRDAGQAKRIFAFAYGVDELEAALQSRLQRFVAAGRRQVAGELQRQRAAQGPAGAPAGQGVTLADSRRRKRRDARQGASGVAAEGAVAAHAAVMAAGLLVAMRGAAATAVTSRAAAQLTAAALETKILAASDAELLRMSASVSNLVNMGRAAQAAVERDVERAIYSSILDGNTCDECEAMDGETTTDLGEAEGWTPNGMCAGGDRCRCVTVFELRQ